MNYNSLFNLLYSTEISEATKDDIVSRINEPILESVEVKPLVETYLELLDTLVFSTASESLIYNIIDETFSNLDEEFINEVSNEWIKKKVGDSLKSREGAYQKASDSVKSGVIGLSQIRNKEAARSNLEAGKNKAASIQARVEKRNQAKAAEAPKVEAPKSEAPKEGAMSKLKSAVGKVKDWAEKVSPAPKPVNYVGLGRIVADKANKENIGAENLRQKTTQKVEGNSETKTATENKSKKAKTATQEPKVKPVEVKDEKPKVEAPKEEPKVKTPEVKAEVKADDATKAVKKAATKTKTSKVVKAEKETTSMETPKENKSVQTTLDLSTPKKETTASAETAKKNTSVKNTKKKKEEKVETSAPEVKEQPTAEVKGKPTAEVKEQPKEISQVNEPSTEDTNKNDNSKKKTEGASLPQEGNSKKAPKREGVSYRNYRTLDQQIKDLQDSIDTRKSRYERATAPGGDPKEAAEHKKIMDELTAKLEKLKSQKVVSEALSDLACLLAHTNISESCFVEVFEMLKVNQENAKKAMDRDEKAALEIADSMNDDLMAGKGLDPEKVNRAEQIAKKKAQFEQIYNRKFNNNN